MKIIILLLSMWVSISISGQKPEEWLYKDKIRIREAMLIAEKIGDKVWEGYNSSSFSILLITDQTEFLINHPNPSKDFVEMGFDSILQTKVMYRKRVLSKNMLATFTPFNGIPCVVIGTAENTGKNASTWVTTLLHERFHLYQFAMKDYYEGVEQLNLAGNDKTGMWMLNYPFPYDSVAVQEQYRKMSQALYKATTDRNTVLFRRSFKTYIAERKKFQSMLSEKDYTYFSFQLWQEGIARYTEYKLLRLLDNYQPSDEFKELPGYIDFRSIGEDILRHEKENLLQLSLNKQKRICFYSYGFMEGLILDQVNPSWRKQYPVKKFNVAQYSNKYQ